MREFLDRKRPAPRKMELDEKLEYAAGIILLMSFLANLSPPDSYQQLVGRQMWLYLGAILIFVAGALRRRKKQN